MAGTVIVMIPGRPVETQFGVLNSSEVWLQVKEAEKVHEIGVGLLAALPSEDAALGVFLRPMIDDRVCSTIEDPSGGWLFLGQLNNEQASAVLRVPWPVEALSYQFSAQLVMALRPRPGMESLNPCLPPRDQETRQFAKFVATDLFRYIESFSRRNELNQEIIVLRTDSLDQWFKRFETRLARNPYFWLQVDRI